jgi:vancomycin aglycone glucosyltransferase
VKVLLSSIGSRGDVQPILALARELQARGHTPRLCVAPNFKPWIASFGIECATIGPDLQQFTLAGGMARPTPEQLQALAEQSVRDQFVVIEQAAQGCDALVAAGALQIAARSVAERLGAKYLFAAYAPNAFPSADHVPARTMPGEPDAFADPGALWNAEAQRWNARFLPTLNGERAKRGLAPVDDVMHHIFTDALWLATDRVLGPAPSHTDLKIAQTGAWFMHDAAPLPDALARFLDAGEPPIYFGFGSMRGADQTARTLIEAARRLGRRAVLLQGWSHLAPIDAGADCIGSGDVNHAALFPRVCAVVHHGGAGTTHAAARAGVPQVIVPHSYDQFYWGRRVAELGIGAVGPSRDALTTAALVAALQQVWGHGFEKARALATHIDVHGAAIAARRMIEPFP